jgi:uncharacterized OB-fold protein
VPDGVPALPHIVIGVQGLPVLSGMRCAACGVVLEGERTACPACGARGSLEAIELGRTGTIAAHTLVCRSLPGVAAPFLSVVVDLDGGGTVRGTLSGTEPPASQRVAMVFRDSGQRTREGKPFLCYYFEPEGSA